MEREFERWVEKLIFKSTYFITIKNGMEHEYKGKFSI
jgi:hypothetical protein